MHDINASLLLMYNPKEGCKNLKEIIEKLPLDVHIYDSEEEAVKLLSESQIDIVISEYVLENGNGIDFLKTVQKISNKSTRVIVGEKANEELIIKSVIKGIACTYIDETAHLDLIESKITDIARVRSSMRNERLNDICPETSEFPIDMSIYEQLMEAINDDKPIPEISEIISKDITLTSKVLQVANSAFYGNFSGTSVEKAILYMGLTSMKDIVLFHSLSTNLKMTADANAKLTEIIKHSIETNYYFHAIAKKSGNCPITPLNNSIGIVHDIGKLVQLVYFPIEHSSIAEYRKEHPETDYYTSELKTENNDNMHTELGAYFLRSWNFNQYSIEAALFHHAPENASADMRPCIEALFLANTVADIRDGYEISMEEALEKCEHVKLNSKELLSILPPM